MKYLLDTDTCIGVLRGRDSVLEKIASVAPDDCVVSTITVYELAVGVAKSREPDREFSKVHRFLTNVHVVPFEADAARQAGGLRASLERTGLSIGPYDTLLAGQALILGLTLVTANLREFSRVEGLRSERW